MGQKMTSAYASKLIRKLNEDKEYWLELERTGHLYTAAVGETPVIPDYDYGKVASRIEEIDNQICVLKHAINKANVESEIDVEGKTLSADRILVRMAQLNGRKLILDNMRKQQPQKRLPSGYGARTTVAEYQYINYDLELIRNEYDRIDREISAMQLALDHYNQTEEFEVEL